MSKTTTMTDVDTRLVRRCASGYDWNTVNDGEYLYFGNDKDANLYADGTGVKLGGTCGILFDPTLVPDSTRTKYIWAYGTRATAKDLTMVASTGYNLDPVQMNLNIIGTAPTSSTVNLSYMNITHAFANMSALRLKCSDWTISIAKNIQDAYVYQGEVDITATTAISGEATVLGLTMYASAGTVTGLVRGAIIAMYGASMPGNSAGLAINTGVGATLTHGIILATQGGTTMTNAIYVEDGGTVANILKFAATSAAVVSKSNSGTTQSYTIRCAVGGVTGYLHLYTD